MDSIPSPSPSVKTQLFCIQKFVDNTQQCFAFTPFPPIIWIFTEGEGDWIKSRLSSEIFFMRNISIFKNQNSIFWNNLGWMSMKESMKSLDLLPLETKIATVLPQDFTLESTIIFHGSQIFWWNQVSNSILNSDFEKYISTIDYKLKHIFSSATSSMLYLGNDIVKSSDILRRP